MDASITAHRVGINRSIVGLPQIGDKTEIANELEKITRAHEEVRSEFDMMKGALNTVKQRISK